MKKYLVWYKPYGMDGEEDCMETTAKTEKEARYFVSAFGYVTMVETL